MEPSFGQFLDLDYSLLPRIVAIELLLLANLLILTLLAKAKNLSFENEIHMRLSDSSMGKCTQPVFVSHVWLAHSTSTIK